MGVEHMFAFLIDNTERVFYNKVIANEYRNCEGNALERKATRKEIGRLLEKANGQQLKIIYQFIKSLLGKG